MSANPRLLASWLAASLVLVATLLVVSCSDDGETSDTSATAELPVIVTTTGILGDVVSEVTADAADVRVLTPPDVDPRQWEPDAAAQDQLDRADLIVSIGLDYEAGAAARVDQAESEGVPVFRSGSEVPTQPHGGSRADTGDPDPYFWMDPRTMAEVIPTLSDRLGQLSSALADEATIDRSTVYVDVLLETDAHITEQLAEIADESRALITDGEGLGYFADRYDLELVDIANEDRIPGARLGASELARLDRAYDGDVSVIELWIEQLGEPRGPAADYLQMLRADADLVAGALLDIEATPPTSS